MSATNPYANLSDKFIVKTNSGDGTVTLTRKTPSTISLDQMKVDAIIKAMNFNDLSAKPLEERSKFVWEVLKSDATPVYAQIAGNAMTEYSQTCNMRSSESGLTLLLELIRENRGPYKPASLRQILGFLAEQGSRTATQILEAINEDYR
jgi:hypothetical protein